MKPTLIALLTIFLSLPLVAADKDKPLPKDFKSLKTLAEKGDAKVQSRLGVMYYRGEGVEQDFKEAVKWLQKSADQGYAKAQIFTYFRNLCFGQKEHHLPWFGCSASTKADWPLNKRHLR